MTPDLTQWLGAAALIAWVVFFGLSLRRLLQTVGRVRDDDSARLTRTWSIRAGFSLPAVFIPMFVSIFVQAAEKSGLASVVVPATIVLALMIGGGGSTAFVLYRLVRRA